MNLPDRSESTASRLRSALLASGLRVTRQRAAVYHQLLNLNHPTAEEVFRWVQHDESSVSLATTYKALDALVQSGLATRLTSRGSSRYDARRDDHYHLVCLRTGAVVDLDTPFDPELIRKIDPQMVAELDRQGFKVTGYRLDVVGYFAHQDSAERGEDCGRHR